MNFAGLQKTTLIDYPGKIATTVFTSGCNFRCPFCHNPELVNKPSKDFKFMDIDDLLVFLKKRKTFLDALVITGGEPLLQENLIDFIKEIKKLKYLVKVDTNGFLTENLAKLMQMGIVDYWAMDVKGDAEFYSKCAGVNVDFARIQQSIQLLKKCGVNYEFRTTVVPGLHDEAVIENVGKLINGAKRFYIQNFRPNVTLDPTFMKIIPFSPSILEKFRRIMESYAGKVEIRGM